MLIGINVNKSFIILVLMIILYSFKRPNNYVFFFCEALGKSSMLVFFIIELILSKDNIKKETDTPNITCFQSNETIKKIIIIIVKE